MRDARSGELSAPRFQRRLRLGQLKHRAIEKGGKLHLPLFGQGGIMLQQIAADAGDTLCLRNLQKAVEIDAYRQRGRRRFFQKGAQKRHEILLFRAVTP